MSDTTHKPDTTPGIISWNELASHDPEASTSFYSQLFGWKAQPMDMGPHGSYTILNAGNRPAAGLIQMPSEAKGAPTMWIGYVTVAKLEHSVAKAQALGAQVLKEITRLPMGSFAVIADPQGAVIGLWEFAVEGNA